MNIITITPPDELMQKLQELAKRHQVTPEELVRATVEDLVSAPTESLEQALKHILSKNEDLYKKLAT